MTCLRNKPVIYTTSAPKSTSKPGDDPMGCVWMSFVILIGYFILRAITAVESGTATWFDKVVCWGTFGVFLVSLVLSYAADAPVRKAKALEKAAWIKACTTAEVKILQRHESGSYDDGYRFHSYPCRLELEMNADQRTAAPNQTVVSVEVWDTIYTRLEKRDTVRIYYWSQAPLAFLLEEELKYQ